LLRNARDALEKEDYAAALQLAQKCLEMDPSSRDCFDVEGMVAGRTGDFATERILTEECLYDDPNDVGCLESIAKLDAMDGQFDSAQRAADRLRQLAPNSTSSALADAIIADFSGDRATALNDYEQACSRGQEYACFRAQDLRKGASTRGGPRR